MKLSSFKQSAFDVPLPPRTPSPILRFVEPLTPPPYPTAYKDGPLSPNNSASGIADSLQNYVLSRSNGRNHTHTTSEKVQSAKAERAVASSRQANRNGNRSASHGSPIDALADIASSMAPSPVFAPHAAFSVHSHASPQSSMRPVATGSRHSHAASDGQNYRYGQGHNYGYNHGYGCDERPSKRARSEVAPSEQYGQGAARPATSHIPALERAYNFEPAMQNGQSAYHEQVSHTAASTNNDEMDIAQVLLGLRNGSIDSSRGARRSIAAPQAHYNQTGFPSWYEVPTTQTHQPAEAQNRDPGMADGHYRQRAHASSFSAPQPEPLLNGSEVNEAKFGYPSLSATQTHTPPDETYDPSNAHATRDDPAHVEHRKGKGHQGWPKGKPRGPRSKASSKKTSKPTASVHDGMLAPSKDDGSDQLQSPQSLPGEPAEPSVSEQGQPNIVRETRVPAYSMTQARANATKLKRRSSFGAYNQPGTDESIESRPDSGRASSVPAETVMAIRPLKTMDSAQRPQNPPGVGEEEATICAGCSFSRGPSTGQKDQWIGCNGCQNWYHFACAGFKNAKEVSSVDKYFCRACRPKFGSTTCEYRCSLIRLLY